MRQRREQGLGLAELPASRAAVAGTVTAKVDLG